MSAPMIDESLSTETTDETCTSSVIAPKKRKEVLGDTERPQSSRFRSDNSYQSQPGPSGVRSEAKTFRLEQEQFKNMQLSQELLQPEEEEEEEDDDDDDDDDGGGGKSRAKTEVSLSSEEGSECLEPQEIDGPFKIKTNDYEEDGGGDDDDDDNDDDGDGKYSTETECSGEVSAEKEFEGIGDRCVVPEVFTPECCPYNERRSYRFTCSSKGLFQCRYTGLVFKMETEGEMQYRTEPWNCEQLAHNGYVPAGPLFDIKCPQGTLSQLHFPHCEIFGKGRKHLTVIHTNDYGESEMLSPHETTHSYVTLNISGCSNYGLTKRQPKKKFDPINCQVLLFLQEKTLNILLLPKNFDICEVCEKRKKMKEPGQEIYIETNSNCELVPKRLYCLSTDPEEHKVTPKSAKFLDYENYTNYFPTFQVFLTRLERVELSLKEGTRRPVWCNEVRFPAGLTGGSPSASSPSSPYTPPGQNFFHKHKAALETRLGTLGGVLSALETCNVLSSEEREEVEGEKSRPKRNRVLLDMLERKGGRAQEEFYKVLKKCDQYLVDDLEGPYEL